MCWRSNDTVIKKVAERDFYVYKIGKIVWNNIFISDIRGYNYAPKCPNRIVPLVPYNLCVNSYIIDRGYYSYSSVNFVCDSIAPGVGGTLSKTVQCRDSEKVLSIDNPFYLATFVILKNSVFFINEMGTIISNYIRYTGKYIKL